MTSLEILELLDILSLYKAFRDPEQYDIAEMLHEGIFHYLLHPSLSENRKPDICDTYHQRSFIGSSIPDLFPFHEHSNDDPDIIFANVHPACKCTLTTTKRAPPIRDFGPELLGLPEEQPEPIEIPEEI